MFLLEIRFLIINKIFIHSHIFSISEDFKERHRNTGFALKAEVTFLCLLQLDYVFLGICWWPEITTASRCAVDTVLPSAPNSLPDDTAFYRTTWSQGAMNFCLSEQFQVIFGSLLMGSQVIKRCLLKGKKAHLIPRYNFQGHYHWSVPVSLLESGELQ